MSLVFIAANKYTRNAVTASGGFFLDCTVSIQHNFENAVTEYAVEEGVAISDHVQVKNNRFTVNGVYQRKSPLNKFNNDLLPFEDRVQQAYNFLKRIRDTGETITLVSKFEVYENCVVESFNFDSNVANESVLEFSISFVQIRFASTESVNIIDVTRVTPPKQDDAAVTTDEGKQQTQSTDKNGFKLYLTSNPVYAFSYITYKSLTDDNVKFSTHKVTISPEAAASREAQRQADYETAKKLFNKLENSLTVGGG